MIRKEFTTHALVRAEKVRRYVAFKSKVGGLIPYLKRQALEIEGSAPRPLILPQAVETTRTFEKAPDLSSYDSPFVHQCRYTMKHIGKMDPYNFGSQIPKFDPWVRDLVREVDPTIEEALTDRFLRDPSTPDRIMKHFSRYDQRWKRIPRTRTMDTAKSIVKKMFTELDSLISPIDLNFHGWSEIVEQLEMSSSPGLPLRREFTTQADCLPYIYDKAKRLNHFSKFLAPWKVRAPPCMIGLRPGLTEYDTLDEKVKARGVWAYPAEVKVVEMRYTIPILKQISQLFGKTPYTTGVNMTKCLPMVIDHLLSPGKKGMVTDISHLDDSVGPEYIDWAFDLIEGWFDMGLTPSGIERNTNTLKFIRYYFKRTLVLLPSGQLVRKYGGVPSGSGFTQIVDTLVSLLISVYAMLQQGMTEDDIIGNIFAVGDDVATSVPPTFSLDKFAESVRYLGFDVNKDKIYFSDKGEDLIFLGYSKYGGHVKRELTELLKTALFPERFVGTSGRSCSRLLGQHIASGLCNNAFSGLLHKAFAKRLFAPLNEEEDYAPQTRWIRKVMNIESIPEYPDASTLFTYV
jgi:hypothetical protein